MMAGLRARLGSLFLEFVQAENVKSGAAAAPAVAGARRGSAHARMAAAVQAG